METKEQKRSVFALEQLDQQFGKQIDEESANFIMGVPTMILMNGLGQTLAFLLSKKDSDKHNNVYCILRNWLQKQQGDLASQSDLEFLTKFSSLEQNQYLTAQHEALALLQWVKRYAPGLLRKRNQLTIIREGKMDFIPIPETQQELLKSGVAPNYSLYFQRMTQWHQDNQTKIESKYLAEKIRTRDKIKEIYDSSIIKLRNHASVCFGLEAGLALDRLHRNQLELLMDICNKGGFFLEFKAKLISPFISGLGATHPTETGMILDRNTGLPYLPASGIKGVMRLACALILAEQDPNRVKPGENEESGQWVINDREPLLRKYFGDTATDAKDGVRGQLVFLDAFPVQVPELRPDIMNPHYQTYYQGINNPNFRGPVDDEDPIPVKFLTVKQGTEFFFRIFALPLAEGSVVERDFGDTDRNFLIEVMRKAMTELGMGAKTSVGYGHFAQLEENSAAIRRKIVQEKERKEKEQQEAKLKEAQEEAERQRQVAAEQVKMEKQQAQQVYQEALASAEGIDKDILLMQRGDEQLAIQFYDRYFKNLPVLNDQKQYELATQINIHFKKGGKKEKPNKQERKQKLNSLIDQYKKEH